MKKNIYILLSFIFFAFIGSALLIQTKSVFSAYDLQFISRRMAELSESIRSGFFLPKYSFNYMHGSAVMTTYPYITIYPLSLLYILTNNFISTIYIFYISLIYISLIISYYSSLSISKDRKISFLFSIIYNVSAAMIGSAFVNMDFGILISLVGLPLVLFGMLDLIENNNYLKLTLGMTLIIFSHVVNSIIALLIVFILVMVNIKKINYYFFNLMKSAFLTLGITCVTWLPFLIFMYDNGNSINTPVKHVLNGIGIKEIILGSVKSDLLLIINTFTVLGIILFIIFYRRINDKNIKCLSFISIFLIIACSNVVPWEYTKYIFNNDLGVFQYLARFYILPFVMISYVFAYCFIRFIYFKIDNNRIIYISVVLLCIFISLLSQYRIIKNHTNSTALNSEYISNNLYSSDYDKNIKVPNLSDINKYYIHNQGQFHNVIDCINYMQTDYFPKSLNNHMFDFINSYQGTRYFMIHGHTKNTIVFHRIGYNKFEFKNKEKLKMIYIPFVIYKGEKLMLLLDNKNYHYSSNREVLKLNNIAAGKHTIVFNSINSYSYYVSIVISFMTVLIYMFLIFDKFRKLRNVYSIFK